MNRSCCISMIHRKKYSHWLIFQLNHLLCYLFSISLWICITVMHLNCYRSLLASKSHKVPTSKIWDFFAFCVKSEYFVLALISFSRKYRELDVWESILILPKITDLFFCCSTYLILKVLWFGFFFLIFPIMSLYPMRTLTTTKYIQKMPSKESVEN